MGGLILLWVAVPEAAGGGPGKALDGPGRRAYLAGRRLARKRQFRKALVRFAEALKLFTAEETRAKTAPAR